MKFRGRQHHHILLSLALCFLSSCSFKEQLVLRPHPPIEREAILDEVIELPDDGPKLSLFRRGEEYFYRLSRHGRDAIFESHISSHGAPAHLEIIYSSDFVNLIIREDLTDAAPAVFYIYLRTDSNGAYHATYWTPPIRQFDISTPLGVECPHIESIDAIKVAMRYPISNERLMIRTEEIKGSQTLAD